MRTRNRKKIFAFIRYEMKYHNREHVIDRLVYKFDLSVNKAAEAIREWQAEMDKKFFDVVETLSKKSLRGKTSAVENGANVYLTKGATK